MNSSRVNCPISYSINERRIASRLLSCDIGAVDDKNFHQHEPTLINIPYLLKVQDRPFELFAGVRYTFSCIPETISFRSSAVEM